MENNMNEKVYIKITNAGVCRTLGYMVTPSPVVRCTLAEVYDILNEGLEVMQVDENDNIIGAITLDMFSANEVIVEEIEPEVTDIKKEELADTETIEVTPIVNESKKLNNKWKK